MNSVPSGVRNTRTAIIAAATREFADLGFAGARVARIAESAGVNKQLIFYYFGSKRGLYEELTRKVASVYSAGVSSTTGAAPTLKQLVENLFRGLAESPEAVRLYFQVLTDAGSPSAAGVTDVIPDIRTAVIVGQGRGQIRDDLDPDYVARQIILLLVGYFLFEPVMFDADSEAREAWFQRTWSLLNRWLTW